MGWSNQDRIVAADSTLNVDQNAGTINGFCLVGDGNKTDAFQTTGTYIVNIQDVYKRQEDRFASYPELMDAVEQALEEYTLAMQESGLTWSERRAAEMCIRDRPGTWPRC